MKDSPEYAVRNDCEGKESVRLSWRSSGPGGGLARPSPLPPSRLPSSFLEWDVPLMSDRRETLPPGAGCVQGRLDRQLGV